MNVPLHSRILCVAFAAAVSASALANFPKYVVLDVGLLPGTDEGFANGINESGVVVGFCRVNGADRAFRWNKFDGIEPIGSLIPDGSSTAFAVNESGQIAGYAQTAGGQRAFFWDPNSGFTQIPVLQGGNESFGFGINDSGVVVGSSGSNQGNRAFRWTSGEGIQALIGVTTSLNDAFGVNSAGVIAGSGTFQAFRWDGTASFLGTLPGGNISRARNINDAGVVVGYGTVMGGIRAFRWVSGSGIQNLGAFPGDTDSIAYGINTEGAIVGSTGNVNGSKGFLWTEADGLQDINLLLPPDAFGWSVQAATAINDQGWIAGWGTQFGEKKGFVLKPRKPGDTDGNDEVDLDDYFNLADAFRTGPGEDGWNPLCDFDDSDFIDLDDYFILADNYRQ